MKKVFLLLLTVASAMAFAGGEIAPVEPMVVAPAVVASPIKFYVGGGYSRVDVDGSGIGTQIYQDYALTAIPTGVAHNYNMDGNNFLLLAGVKFNEYFAVEGRYSNSFKDSSYTYTADNNTTSGDLSGGKIESYGIYAKPMYPVTEQIDVYGLLGYANVNIDGDGGNLMNDGDFSWGAGASYEITNNFSVFADYVRLYDDTVSDTGSVMNGDKVKVDSVNVGLIYTF
jgi:opacity protein-like surface antigen